MLGNSQLHIPTEINLKSSWQREGGKLPKLFWNIPKQTNATSLVAHQTRTKTFYMGILDCENVRKFTTEINLKSSWQREGGCQRCSKTFKSKQNATLLVSNQTRAKTFYVDILHFEKPWNFHHNRNKLEKLMAEGGREAAKAVLKHSKANKRYIACCTLGSNKDLWRGRILDCEKVGKFTSQQKSTWKAHGRGREGSCQSCSETFWSNLTLRCSFHTRLEQRPFTWTFWIVGRFGSSQQK